MRNIIDFYKFFFIKILKIKFRIKHKLFNLFFENLLFFTTTFTASTTRFISTNSICFIGACIL